MNVEHLELFVIAAQLGNLTRAAAQLGITQPTATRWLQALELETSGPLFERARRGLRPTPLGRAFLPFAERSVRAVAEGVAHVREVSAGREGRLVIGCSDVTSTYFLPGLLRGFRQAHVGADIRVRTGSSGAITDAVANHEIEIALVTAAPGSPVFETRLLAADEHVFVAQPSDGLLSRSSVELAEVAARGVISYSIGEPSGRYGLAPFVAAHLAPRVAMEVDTVETAKRMVAEGFGVALLPQMVVADDIASGRLAALPVAVDLGHWHVRIARLSDAHPLGPASAFWDWCAGDRYRSSARSPGR